MKFSTIVNPSGLDVETLFASRRGPTEDIQQQITKNMPAVVGNVSSVYFYFAEVPSDFSDAEMKSAAGFASTGPDG